jgi:hypothetical protein
MIPPFLARNDMSDRPQISTPQAQHAEFHGNSDHSGIQAALAVFRGFYGDPEAALRWNQDVRVKLYIYGCHKIVF